jgi:hypothetical protein
MTKAEFEDLHRQCTESLQRYMDAATRLCELLGDAAERTPTLQDRSLILDHRNLENRLYNHYLEIRTRLLEAARIGFGDLVL